jgi:hypothetical protein
MAQMAEVAQAYHENLPLTENDLSRRMAMAAANDMFVPEPWRGVAECQS